MNPDLMAVYASLGQGRVKLHAATARIQRYIREDLDRLHDAEEAP